MSSSPLPTAFYADPATLTPLKGAARAQDPQALKEAARQFESLFTQMMLKSMRAASFGDEMAGSETTDFYQEMHDTQLALQLSKGRGLGLADMLVEQLTRAGLVRGEGDRGQGTGDSQQENRVQRTVYSGQSEPLAPASSLQPPASGFGSSPQPPASSLSAWPPATREQFVQQIQPHADVAARALGVDSETLIAHAALETGWGKHIPAGPDGSCSFNLFGIKAGSAWRGSTVGVSTLEYEDGVATRRVDRFRAYTSPAECFQDYAALLGGSSRYAAARGAGSDEVQFAQGLQRGGYATDPNYARKLAAVTESVRALLKDPISRPLMAGGVGK